MPLRDAFIDALKDYLFLLEKEYPQKATLKLVSDRYRLNTQERSMLYRGVVTEKQKRARRKNTTDQLPTEGTLYLDGFNVLRTIASYLLGRPVFVAMDSFVRDASELHGKPLKTEWRLKAFDLVLKLIGNRPLTLHIWLDAPVSKSGETAQLLNESLKKIGMNGLAETVASADHELKQVTKGMVATADSAIIESAHVPVIDLAQMVIRHFFSPDLVDLGKLVNDHAYNNRSNQPSDFS